LFQIVRPNKWKLASCKDNLFATHGFPAHEEDISRFLNAIMRDYDPDSDFVFLFFNIDEYNATAETKLIVGVDYEEPNIIRYIIGDKQYAIVDAFTYINFLETRRIADATVDIVVFDGHRSHELEALCEQYRQEQLESTPRHVDASCDVGQFIVGVLAHDQLTLRRDSDTNVYSYVSASTPSLAFIYETDADFFKELSPHIFEKHKDAVSCDVMFESIDTRTVVVSAMSLELLWAATRPERPTLSTLHTRNTRYLLSINHKSYKKRQISATETCEYVDMNQSAYLMYRGMLESWTGKEADPLIFSFAGE
jgi:hypothetical protein